MRDPQIPDTVETIELGPFPLFLTNVNKEMGLPAHSHGARLTVVYETVGDHGFPSFEETNQALYDRVLELTGRPFKEATNEAMARRIFRHLDGWVADSWIKWGGDYRLDAIRLEIDGVRDRIGHDPSTTVYTIERLTP